eukprot:CAMPEP_0171278062 /NCGR_PEP_ID=MMETSP0790-20130122/64678_1 /TAXON_ID=2925 /ORGANISM="Alexandrium catenella, Strain OF101" /LENGTH=241 /DNA_ID=CAMNT_0011747213 /DNA_START=225 /DNA_END=950 /DNA_ORIENTATION=-
MDPQALPAAAILRRLLPQSIPAALLQLVTRSRVLVHHLRDTLLDALLVCLPDTGILSLQQGGLAVLAKALFLLALAACATRPDVMERFRGHVGAFASALAALPLHALVHVHLVGREGLCGFAPVDGHGRELAGLAVNTPIDAHGLKLEGLAVRAPIDVPRAVLASRLEECGALLAVSQGAALLLAGLPASREQGADLRVAVILDVLLQLGGLTIRAGALLGPALAVDAMRPRVVFCRGSVA